MDSHRTTHWLPLAALITVTWAILLGSPNFRWTDQLRPQSFGGDALQEWLGSTVARSDPDRLYDQEHTIALQHKADFVGYRFASDGYFPMVYPPFYYVALRPLSYLSARQAAYVLLIAMVLCAAAAFLLLARANRTPCAAPYVPVVLTLSVLFVPLLLSLCTAQKSALVLLIFTATYHLYRTNRRFAAGVIAGLLGFKPQLALVTVAVFLWRRDWRLLAGMSVCACVLLLLCLPVGLDTCWDYVAFARSADDYAQTGGYELTQSHSLYGFFALMRANDVFTRTLVPTTKNGPGGTSVMWATWLGLAVIGLLLSQICKTRKCNVEREDDVDFLFAAIVLATPLASPHFYSYDLAILILPMFLIWNMSLRDAKYHSLGWLAGMLYVAGALSVPVAKATGIQVSVLLMAGSLGWLVWLLSYGAVAGWKPAKGERSSRRAEGRFRFRAVSGSAGASPSRN